jgi:hypothetical protein
MTARRAGGKKRKTPTQGATAKKKRTAQTARPARRSLAERVEVLRQAFEGAGIGLVNLVQTPTRLTNRQPSSVFGAEAERGEGNGTCLFIVLPAAS